MKWFCIALLLSATCLAQTQQAQDLISAGNAAAHSDDHWGAIRNYEQAIEADRSTRNSLLLKLGQQYLWADRADKAAKLLGEYVAIHPTECDAKFTYALALSWSNQLSSAEFEYRDIAAKCPGLKNDALLGEARVLRWRERNSAAARVYRQVLQNGTEAQKSDAKIGLGLIKLAQDQNRAARDDFRSLMSQPKPDPAAVEGLAVSELHLGLPEQARRDLNLGHQSGARSPQLDALSEHIQTISSPQFAPGFRFFHDADGTNYVGGEARSSFGLTSRGTVAAFFSASNLARDTVSITGKGGGLALDYRVNETFAFRGEGRFTQYSNDFNPVTGEADAIITPTDNTRVDAAVARITIWDAPTALENHLAGTFGSIGLDQRITALDKITFGFSATGWNDGNRRLVFRFTPSHSFEGRPRITLSLPMLYQSYDRAFTFGLFSPTSYTEITPALDIHFRRSRIWNFDLGARLGGQKEAALEWKPIGAFHATVERDLKHGWGLQATVAHSSSNVASSTGFSRTSFFFTVARTF